MSLPQEMAPKIVCPKCGTEPRTQEIVAWNCARNPASHDVWTDRRVVHYECECGSIGTITTEETTRYR